MSERLHRAKVHSAMYTFNAVLLFRVPCSPDHVPWSGHYGGIKNGPQAITGG